MRKQFAEWLMNLINEKQIELGEFVAPGVQVGDVVQNIIFTTTREQQQIKKVLVEIDFRNGDVLHFFKHLAQAL